MFQEMLKSEEFIEFIIQVHIIPQNIFLMQNKIFISFPTKIKNTSVENKKFISNFFSNFGRYIDNSLYTYIDVQNHTDVILREKIKLPFSPFLKFF